MAMQPASAPMKRTNIEWVAPVSLLRPGPPTQGLKLQSYVRKNVAESLPVKGFQQFIDGPVEILIGASLLIDLGNGVHHGSMVLTTKLTPDLRK